MVDGNIMKIQKSRQRRILSCINCHAKKVKCSRVHPLCDHCKKLGLECKYFINKRVSQSGRRKQPEIKKEFTDLGELQEQAPVPPTQTLALPQPPLESLHESLPESLHESLPERLHESLPEPLQESIPPAEGQEKKTKVYEDIFSPKSAMVTYELQPPNATLPHNITNSFFNTNYMGNTEEPMFVLSPFPFTPTELLKSPALKKADTTLLEAASDSVASGNSMSFSESSLESTSGSDNGMRNDDRTEKRTAFPGLQNSLSGSSSKPATTVNYLYGTNLYYNNANLLNDLMTHLPVSKERLEELVERYASSVHILLPIMVNWTSFVEEHGRFWAHLNLCGELSFPADFDLLGFYTLYFPVLYAATMSEFEEYDNLLLNQDINRYLKGFNRICQHYNYPHGIKTIPLLLGNVIIQSILPNVSTLEMSQIIRYAKFLHFHKDPVILLRIADPQVVLFRRLLWWVIFGLDALSSHNFCLPPVCKFDDFNVLPPSDEEPADDGPKLNVTMLAMTVKFRYDRILSELVYHLHNGLSINITPEEVKEIKIMIVSLFHYIHKAIAKLNAHYKQLPPKSVQEMNLLNFLRNHLWSFVDRALMLLHKKMLLRDQRDSDTRPQNWNTLSLTKNRGGALLLSKYEDTFGQIQEANIIANFDNSLISQLRFNQHELFTYENLSNNLIPLILHNLNDFLKYNDFIKFGKFNWYIKRMIPIDSIILLFIVICVKFKYEFMAVNELVIYVQLINKALFILNHKYFKNEKYKRMLLLTNLTWEYLMKTYNVKALADPEGRIDFFDYQGGTMNMKNLFTLIDVPQPALVTNGVNLGLVEHEGALWEDNDSEYALPRMLTRLVFHGAARVPDRSLKLELMQLREKIHYDLRNNFVDINECCTFYALLENVLRALMDYVASN